MRDVARMLDAMEAADPKVVAAVTALPSMARPSSPNLPATAATPTDHAPAAGVARHWPVFAMGGATTGVFALLVVMVRRRRAKSRPKPERPSIAGYFTDRAPAPAEPMPPAPASPPSQAGTASSWVYHSASFDIPDMYMIAEPVDLLVQPWTPASASIATAESQSMPMTLVKPEAPPYAALRDRLADAASGTTLHLIGDERFPDIRYTGDAPDGVHAWQAIVEAHVHRSDDEGRLARWLLPALRLTGARHLHRREAEQLLDAVEHESYEALDHATGDESAHGYARWIRIRLARIERLSGATRVFAARDLLARIEKDPRGDDALALDACIDVQLAWASWLLGDAATARLAEAERHVDRLASLGPDAATRALRRRGEVCLRRASTRKPSDRLPDLDRAQGLLDDAQERWPDAETALLVAQAAHQRVALLPPAEADAACSHALIHAFLAEQDHAWRVDAIACRLAIQLTFEALPDHAPQGGVTAALGRSLEAAGPVPLTARITMAEARLREGDHVGAADMCESIWRSHAADRRVLDLWREACRHWADDPTHDTGVLARALRQLTIARSTL